MKKDYSNLAIIILTIILAVCITVSCNAQVNLDTKVTSMPNNPNDTSSYLNGYMFINLPSMNYAYIHIIDYKTLDYIATAEGSIGKDEIVLIPCTLPYSNYIIENRLINNELYILVKPIPLISDNIYDRGL